MPRYTTAKGYVMIRRPDVSGHYSKGYVYEHRAIWTDEYGAIPEGGVIHHLDGNKSNNHISNLSLVSSNSLHRSVYHSQLGRYEPATNILQPFTAAEMIFIREHLVIDSL